LKFSGRKDEEITDSVQSPKILTHDNVNKNLGDRERSPDVMDAGKQLIRSQVQEAERDGVAEAKRRQFESHNMKTRLSAEFGEPALLFKQTKLEPLDHLKP
jgi:hypothetical protein